MLADSDTIISGTEYVKSKITNEDCILIYGGSSLITHLIIQASRKYSKIRVIVVDSRPKLNGKHVLEQLVKHGIDCTYVLINALSFVMNKVTKVILGAHALLANGYIMNTIGSSQIALIANSFNVPVVVCCETYKFCEKVQTDAFVNNELGNPLDLLSYSSKNSDNLSPLAEWKRENKDPDSINMLNLIYDIIAPNFISCVVSDMGMLPCSSVPVVLRLKNRDNFVGGKKQPIKHDN
jgi:translation initiation factor eIF-2B subunit delta